MGGLTLKQQAFVDYYLSEKNATEAVRKAGYKIKYPDRFAGKLLVNPKIKTAIQERLKQIESERILTAKQRHEFLSSVICNMDELMTNRLKAVDLLNKMTGEYLERREVEVRGSVNNPFDGISTDDIKALIHEQGK